MRANDPFWDSHYPPNGWRCSCRVAPTSEAGLARVGKSRPDTAPPLETRTWINPHNGTRHQVPIGIDPGFDYNVGKAWQAGGRDLPVRSLGWKPEGEDPPVQTLHALVRRFGTLGCGCAA